VCTLYSESANISASVCSMYLLSTEPPSPLRLESGGRLAALSFPIYYSARRRFPPRLGSVHRAPSDSANQLAHFDHLMDPLSTTSAIVRLAIPVFKCAKELRDKIKLVRYPPHPLHTITALMIILHPCSQVASEKAELLAALIEYEKDMNLLESLYNNNKELLDQHELDIDLKELAEYAWFSLPVHRGCQV
jgi:hypothetical protein